MAKLMLSVVILVKNNAKTLPLVLVNASRHLIRDQITHEIIVVDDDSIDASIDIARRLATLVPYLKIINSKTISGLSDVIKGDFVFFMPADGSASVEEFHKMKRYLKEEDYQVVWALHNYEDSFKIIYNLLMRLPYFKTILENSIKVFCFSTVAFKKLLLEAKVNSMFRLGEILELAKNYKYKIKYLKLNI